jgi:hypothetical protein
MATDKNNSCDINDTSKTCEQLVDQGPAPDETRTGLMTTLPVRVSSKESLEIADRVDHAEHDSPNLSEVITPPNPHAATYVDIPDDPIRASSPELTPRATLQRKNEDRIEERIPGKGKGAAEGEVDMGIPINPKIDVPEDFDNLRHSRPEPEVEVRSTPMIKLENEVFFNVGRQYKNTEIEIIGNRDQRAGMTLDIAGLSKRGYKSLDVVKEPGGRQDQKKWNFLQDPIHDPAAKKNKDLPDLIPKTDVRAQELIDVGPAGVDVRPQEFIEVGPAGIDVRSPESVDIIVPTSPREELEIPVVVNTTYKEPAQDNDFERDLPIREDTFIDDIEAKYDIRSDAALEFYPPFTPQLEENDFAGGIDLGDIYRNKDIADGKPVEGQGDIIPMQNSDYSAFASIRDSSVWVQPSKEDMPLADIIPKLEPELTSKVVNHEGNYNFQDLINSLYFDESDDLLGGQREGLRFNDSAVVETTTNWFYNVRIEGYDKEKDVLSAVNKYLASDEGPDPITVVTSKDPQSNDMAQYNARIDYTLPMYSEDGKANNFSMRDMANYIQPHEFTMPLAEVIPKMTPELSSKVVDHDGYYTFQDLINSLYFDEDNDILGGERGGLRYNDNAEVETTANWYYSVRVEGYNKEKDILVAINKHLADDEEADPISIVTSAKPESWDMAQYNARIDYTLPEYTEDGKANNFSARDMANYIQPSEMTMPLAELIPKMEPVLSSKVVSHEGYYTFQDLINALYLDEENDIIGGSREGLRFNDRAEVETNTNWYYGVRIEGYNKETDILSTINKYLSEEEEADPITIVTSKKPESWDMAQYNARIDYTLPEYSDDGEHLYMSPRDMTNYIKPSEFTMPLAEVTPKMTPELTSKVVDHDPEDPYHFQDLINSLYFDLESETDLLGGERGGLRFNDHAEVETTTNWYYSVRVEGYNKENDILSAINKYLVDDEDAADPINIVTSMNPESWDMAQYNARINYSLPDYSEDGEHLYMSPRDMANYIQPSQFTMPLADLIPKIDPELSSKTLNHEGYYNFQDLINSLYFDFEAETDLLAGNREGLRFNDNAIVEVNTNWYFGVRIEGYDKTSDILSTINKHIVDDGEAADPINIVTSKKPESWDMAQYNARIDYTLPEYSEDSGPIFLSARDMANYVNPSEFSMPLATLIPKQDPVATSKVLNHDPESPYHFQDLINSLYFSGQETIMKYNNQSVIIPETDLLAGAREGLRFNDSAIVEENTNWYFSVRIEGYNKETDVLSSINKYYSKERPPTNDFVSLDSTGWFKTTADPINIVTMTKPESWDMAQYNARIDYSLPEFTENGAPLFWSSRDMANYVNPNEFSMPLATLIPKMDPMLTSKVLNHDPSSPYHFQDLINSLYFSVGDVIKKYDGTTVVIDETDLLAGAREGLRFNDSAIVETDTNWYFSVRVEGYNKEKDILSATNKYYSEETNITADKINIVTSAKPESWDMAQYNSRIDYSLPEYNQDGSPLFWSSRDMANYVNPDEFSMPLATLVPKQDPITTSKVVNHDPESPYHFQDLINSLYFTTGDTIQKYDGTSVSLKETDLLAGAREGLRFNDSAIVEINTNWYYGVRVEGYDKISDTLVAVNKHYEDENNDRYNNFIKSSIVDPINIVTTEKPESWDMAQYNSRINYSLPEYNENGYPTFWSPRDMANYVNPDEFSMPLATLVPKQDPIITSKVVNHEGYYNFQDLINSLYFTTGDTIKKYDGTSVSLKETDLLAGAREGLRFNDSAIVEINTNWYYGVRIEGYNKETDILVAVNKYYEEENKDRYNTFVRKEIVDPINIVTSKKPESWDMAQYNSRINYSLPDYNENGYPTFWSPRDMANYINPDEFSMPLATLVPKQDPITTSKVVNHEGYYNFQDLINSLYFTTGDTVQKYDGTSVSLEATDLLAGAREGLKFNDSAIVEINTNWYYGVRIEGYNKETDILVAVNKHYEEESNNRYNKLVYKETPDPINIVVSGKPESWDMAQYNARIDYTLPEYSENGAVLFWSPRDMANYVKPSEFTMPLSTFNPKQDPVKYLKNTIRFDLVTVNENISPIIVYNKTNIKIDDEWVIFQEVAGNPGARASFQELSNIGYFQNQYSAALKDAYGNDVWIGGNNGVEVNWLAGKRDAQRFSDGTAPTGGTKTGKKASTLDDMNWYYGVRVQGVDKNDLTADANILDQDLAKYYQDDSSADYIDKINIVTSEKLKDLNMMQYNSRIDYTLFEYDEKGNPKFWSPRDMKNYIQPDEFTMPLSTNNPKQIPEKSSITVNGKKYSFQDLINSAYYQGEGEKLGEIIKDAYGEPVTIENNQKFDIIIGNRKTKNQIVESKFKTSDGDSPGFNFDGASKVPLIGVFLGIHENFGKNNYKFDDYPEYRDRDGDVISGKDDFGNIKAQIPYSRDIESNEKGADAWKLMLNNIVDASGLGSVICTVSNIASDIGKIIKDPINFLKGVATEVNLNDDFSNTLRKTMVNEVAGIGYSLKWSRDLLGGKTWKDFINPLYTAVEVLDEVAETVGAAIAPVGAAFNHPGYLISTLMHGTNNIGEVWLGAPGHPVNSAIHGNSGKLPGQLLGFLQDLTIKGADKRTIETSFATYEDDAKDKVRQDALGIDILDILKESTGIKLGGGFLSNLLGAVDNFKLIEFMLDSNMSSEQMYRSMYSAYESPREISSLSSPFFADERAQGLADQLMYSVEKMLPWRRHKDGSNTLLELNDEAMKTYQGQEKDEEKLKKAIDALNKEFKPPKDKSRPSIGTAYNININRGETPRARALYGTLKPFSLTDLALIYGTVKVVEGDEEHKMDFPLRPDLIIVEGRDPHGSDGLAPNYEFGVPRIAPEKKDNGSDFMGKIMDAIDNLIGSNQGHIVNHTLPNSQDPSVAYTMAMSKDDTVIASSWPRWLLTEDLFNDAESRHKLTPIRAGKYHTDSTVEPVNDYSGWRYMSPTLLNPLIDPNSDKDPKISSYIQHKFSIQKEDEITDINEFVDPHDIDNSIKDITVANAEGYISTMELNSERIMIQSTDKDKFFGGGKAGFLRANYGRVYFSPDDDCRRRFRYYTEEKEGAANERVFRVENIFHIGDPDSKTEFELTPLPPPKPSSGSKSPSLGSLL